LDWITNPLVGVAGRCGEAHPAGPAGFQSSEERIRFGVADDTGFSVIIMNAPLKTLRLPQLHLGVSRVETKVPLRATSTDQTSRKCEPTVGLRRAHIGLRRAIRTASRLGEGF